MKTNLKKLLVASAFLMTTVGMVGVVSAHQGKKGERLEEIKAELNLTPAQEKAFKAIQEEKRSKFKELKKSDLPKEEKRAQMRALKAETRAELAKTLDAQQLAKLDAKMEKRKAKFEGKRGERGLRLEKLADELELTEPQRNQIKSIMDDARAERELILEANDSDRRQARPELKAHRQEVKGKIRAVLSAEQAAKFDAMKAKHKGDRKGKRKGQAKKGE